MKKEHKVILLSMLRKRTPQEEEELTQYLKGSLNWEVICGQVIYHRLGGYFFSGLQGDNLKRLPKEFSRALELLTIAQKKQTLEIVDIVTPILKEFDENGVRYAGLKGLIFNADIYTPGNRRSNDTDLLVVEADLDIVDQILRKYGYIQSLMTNGEFKEASRKEKLIQRMNYHDLVPYFKFYHTDYIRDHSFDINFHFDSKTNDITNAVVDFGTQIYENEYYAVKGLAYETHFLQLCVHFYREASNTLWTSRKKDIELYKVVDIINTLRKHFEGKNLDGLVTLLNKFNLQKAGYFTMYTVNQFYEDSTVKELMQALYQEDASFIDEIVVEGENRKIKRTGTFAESAFDLQY